MSDGDGPPDPEPVLDHLAYGAVNPDGDFKSTAGISLWQDGYRRLKKDRLAVLCFFVIVAYIAVALLAQAGKVVNGINSGPDASEVVKSAADAVLFASYDAADRDLGRVGPTWVNGGRWRGSPILKEGEEATAPDKWFLMGTNVQGQSVLARLANGTRIAMLLGLSVAILATLIGAVLGCVAGWFGGFVDDMVVWLYSTVSSIPSIMLIMALAYAWDGGFSAVFMAMGCTYWVGVCRVVRGEFLKLKDRDYVMAARAMGAGNTRIMLQHVLPNTAHLLIISFTLLFVWAIKAEVIISFLGVGFENEPSWGLVIHDAESELTKGAWWQMTFASLALFGIVLAFQIFGDSLRDALDPRLRR